MMDHEEVLRLLRRLFKGGPMARLPKKQRESEVIMALSIVGLDPDGFYDEADINLHLSGWLDGIADQHIAADHITLRRYLVDFGFLRRATDGVIYRIVPERVDEVLTGDSIRIDVKAIYAEAESNRLERQSRFANRN